MIAVEACHCHYHFSSLEFIQTDRALILIPIVQIIRCRAVHGVVQALSRAFFALLALSFGSFGVGPPTD